MCFFEKIEKNYRNFSGLKSYIIGRNRWELWISMWISCKLNDEKQGFEKKMKKNKKTLKKVKISVDNGISKWYNMQAVA